MPGLADVGRIAKGAAIIGAMEDEKSGASKLGAALQADPSFGDLRGGWIQQSGGSGMVLQEHLLPHLMIRGVMSGRSVESLVAEARSFAKSRTSRTEYFAALAGVSVTEPVNLADDIDLVPWADIPDGPQKASFGKKKVLSTGPFLQTPAFATVAIRIRSAKFQVLFASYDDAKTASKTAHDEGVRRSVLVQDIVHCIAALSTHTVAAIGSWSQFEQNVANDFSGAGYSYNGALFDNAVRAASSKSVTVDHECLAELFRRFEQFKASEKGAMRVALDRLGQALRRANIVDKAIDLGIALEVLLLHGISDDNRGELRFRTSIRGAAFLGGTKPERLKTFRLLRSAYDLRSKAVHSGVLKTEKKGLPPEQILEDAIGTCAAIARKLINRGSFPDWDPEYVIGGE